MRGRAYLYFALTFVLGVVLGGVGMFVYAWYGGHWHRQVNRGDFVRYLTHELKLSNQQSTEIQQVLNESRKAYESLRSQDRPQFDALRQKTDAQIRQVLTPQQSAEFDGVIQKWRKSMRR